MFSFTLDYFLFVFFASFGTVQFAASRSGLESILIFRSPKIARIAGLTLVAIAVAVFFVTEDRNINDYDGGLDANQQAYLFVLASFAALVVTMAIGSIRYWHVESEFIVDEGLGSLSRMGYLKALVGSIRYWHRQWKTQISNYLFG
jgi:hypothetical protein